MYEIIAAFIDRRSGRLLQPGDPLPAGMDEAALTRLCRAGCLKPVPAQAAAPEGGLLDADFPAGGSAGAATLAGGDTGGDGERAKPDGGRRKRRKRQS